MSEQTNAVAVLCKCGAAVFLGVRLDDDGKREVGDLVADGYEAKALPLADARAIPFGCRCADKPAPKSAEWDELDSYGASA